MDLWMYFLMISRDYNLIELRKIFIPLIAPVPKEWLLGTVHGLSRNETKHQELDTLTRYRWLIDQLKDAILLSKIGLRLEDHPLKINQGKEPKVVSHTDMNIMDFWMMSFGLTNASKALWIWWLEFLRTREDVSNSPGVSNTCW